VISSATSQEGISTSVSPASWTDLSISAGDMSGEPTIFSRESSSPTVCRASIPSAVAPTPKRIKDHPGRKAAESKNPVAIHLAALHLPS
jgi:hypothetical protein